MGNRADLLARAIAKGIDFVVIMAAAEVLPKAGWVAGLFYILISDGLFEGRSLGKRLVGLRVVKQKTNAPCTVEDSALRNATMALGVLLWRIPFIGWLLGLVIFAIEGMYLLGSPKGLRLGDELAKTSVLGADTPQGLDREGT